MSRKALVVFAWSLMLSLCAAAETTKPNIVFFLIDDLGYPHKLNETQYSGSNYDMHPPGKHTAKPAGEWNTTKIVVKGAHVEHWLNGEKVVDYEFWTPEWQALKEKSKWKDAKDYGMAKQGHLALQDHGGGVWFKNLKVRKL